LEKVNLKYCGIENCRLEFSPSIQLGSIKFHTLFFFAVNFF